MKKDACKGGGRLWHSSSGVPRCPVCRRTAEGLGVPTPPHNGRWWIGPVPLHSSCPNPTKRKFHSKDEALIAVPIGGKAFLPYKCVCGSWHYSTRAPARPGER